MQASLLPTHPPSLVGAGARTPSSPLPGEPLPASWGLWLRWQLSHPPPAQQKGIQGFGAQWPRVQILHTFNPMSLSGGREETEMEGSRNPKPRAWPMNARDKPGDRARRAPPMFLLRVLLDLCLQPHPASCRSLPQE